MKRMHDSNPSQVKSGLIDAPGKPVPVYLKRGDVMVEPIDGLVEPHQDMVALKA